MRWREPRAEKFDAVTDFQREFSASDQRKVRLDSNYLFICLYISRVCELDGSLEIMRDVKLGANRCSLLRDGYFVIDFCVVMAESGLGEGETILFHMCIY